MPRKYRSPRTHLPYSVPIQRMQLLETRSQGWLDVLTKVKCSQGWLDVLTKVKCSQDLSLAIERAFSTNVLHEPCRLPD